MKQNQKIKAIIYHRIEDDSEPCNSAFESHSALEVVNSIYMKSSLLNIDEITNPTQNYEAGIFRKASFCSTTSSSKDLDRPTPKMEEEPPSDEIYSLAAGSVQMFKPTAGPFNDSIQSAQSQSLKDSKKDSTEAERVSATTVDVCC